MNKNQFLKIKKILEFAYNNRYSDFYKKKYKKAGFNPLTDFKSIEDYKKIPFLTKEELVNADPFQLLFVKQKDILCIKATSGTIGKPLYLFSSKFDKLVTTNYPYMPIKSSDKFLYFVDSLNARQIAELATRWQFAISGNMYSLPETARLANDFQINTIFAYPTLAILFKKCIESYPNLNKSLKCLSLGGENLTVRKKKIIQELYPGVKIFTSYGTAENTLLGSQCEYLSKMNDQIIYLHPHFNCQFIEIIDPNTEKELKDGEVGQIVATSFYLRGTPIIRYKIEDLVSIKKGEKCSCGRSSYYMQFLGRIDNGLSIRVAGFELRKEFLEKILDSFKNILGESFEVHIYEKFENNLPKIKLELNLTPLKSLREALSIKQKIENEILERWQISPKLNLRKAIQAGLFEPIRISFINPNPTFGIKVKKKLILHQD
jgi:phenylacetate-CoA ligase